MKKIALLSAAVAAGLWAVSAQAVLVVLPPFGGTTSESFEAFSNGPLPEATPILVKAAKVSSANTDLFVYQPGVVDMPLGGFGNAPVEDGVKGLALASSSDTGTITFASPLSAFGGYWGASSDSPVITVNFYNGATNVGTELVPYAGGALLWGGWFSLTPFDRVTFTGDFVVVDNIQSDAAPVPEPASATAILLSVGLLGIRRCRA